MPLNDSHAGESGCGCHGTTHTRLTHAGGPRCGCSTMIHTLLPYALGPGCECHETTHKSVTNRLGANIVVDKVVICMYRVSERQWRSISTVSFERI